LKLYKLQQFQKQLKAMKKVQRKLDEKIIQLRSKSDFKSVCAFVTFNEDKGKSECVTAYESGFIQRLRGKAKATKKFRGKTSLAVSPAPEPSNVLWENFQHRGLDTTMRGAFTGLMTVLLLCSSFAIGLFIQGIQTQLLPSGGTYLCLIGPQPSDADAQERIKWTQYSSFSRS